MVVVVLARSQNVAADDWTSTKQVLFVIIIFMSNAVFCLYFARAGYRDFKRKMVDDNLAKAARIAERMKIRKADPNYKNMVEVRGPFVHVLCL